MENEYGWSDEELARTAADFCYNPEKSEKENAATWVIERLVLPPNLPAYDNNMLARFIQEKLKKE